MIHKLSIMCWITIVGLRVVATCPLVLSPGNYGYRILSRIVTEHVKNGYRTRSRMY